MGRRRKTPEEKLAERYPLAKQMVEDGSAPEQTVRAVELLLAGKMGREIAEEMGISKSRAFELLHDPTLEKAKARKAKGIRECVDCGAPCNTDGRRTEIAKRCVSCAQAQSKKWGRDEILEAIQRWAAEHGRPPKAQEWHGGTYVHPDYLIGDWPAQNTVKDAFGGFNAAVEAAGFEPFRCLGGQPRRPLTREQLAETAALVEERGLDGAAAALGLSVHGVERRMKQFRNQPIGDNHMPRELTADQIIERELEKKAAKAVSLRADLGEVENDIERLEIAKSALSNGHAAVPSAA